MTEVALSRCNALNTLLLDVTKCVVVLELPGFGDGLMWIRVFLIVQKDLNVESGLFMLYSSDTISYFEP